MSGLTAVSRKGSLIWRKGEQRPGEEGKSIQEQRSSQKAACLWQGGEARVEMLSLEKRAGHRQEGTAARWEALGICKDLKPPGTCPKITEWKKDIKI